MIDLILFVPKTDSIVCTVAAFEHFPISRIGKQMIVKIVLCLSFVTSHRVKIID
jgi:hypothetical protein